MKIAPPVLPEPFRDDADSPVPVFQTTWDALATALLKSEYNMYGWRGGHRLVWLRYSVVHWCCGHPMRIGRCDYHEGTESSLAWQTAPFRCAACRTCGHAIQVMW